MDEAFTAGALPLLKRALFQSHEGVGLEFSAFRTKCTVGIMVGFAVDVDHGFDCFLFAGYAWVLSFGLLGCHLMPPSYGGISV